MADSNQRLWHEESLSRRRLLVRSGILCLILVALAIAVCVWLSQPLFFVTKRAADAPTVDIEALRSHVAKLSNDLYPRNHTNATNLNLAADYIKSEFSKTGGDVSEQTFSVNGAVYRNVILRLGPTEGDLVVVGAHYDAAYQTHGADDNASGVAGLIELAKMTANDKPDFPVEFVAYSLEEPPYFATFGMGSYVHAKSLHDSGTRIRLMVCLEMIGYYTDEPDSQNFPLILGRLLYPSRGNFIAVVGDFTNVATVRRIKSSMATVDGIETYSLNAPTFAPGVALSDQRNYWNFGYDAIMITDTAFYRDSVYHTVGDTADRLNYGKMALVVEAVHRGINGLTK